MSSTPLAGKASDELIKLLIPLIRITLYLKITNYKHVLVPSSLIRWDIKGIIASINLKPAQSS